MNAPNKRKSHEATKLGRLRQIMRKHGVSAYLVPGTDPHQSEYVPSHWQRRAFISGFTGSAGDAVVSLKDAALWTDSRYYLQAQDELQGSGFTLMRMGEKATHSQAEYMKRRLKPGESVGFDPRVLSHKAAQKMREELHPAGLDLLALPENLIDQCWEHRPLPVAGTAETLNDRFAGESSAQKIRRLRKFMRDQGADTHVLTTLDSIAWAFNMRGNDVEYNPLTISYAVIERETATLFLDEEKITDTLRKKLGNKVKFEPYENIDTTLQALAKRRAVVWIDPATCNAHVANLLEGCTLVEKDSPVVAFKARKNTTELDGIRAAHVRDGAAMSRFLHWLHDAIAAGAEQISETSAADKLESFRAQGEHFQGLSFNTISAYAAHGAIVHYAVNAQTNIPLKRKGLFLVDSGGQYSDGTTDITRTVLLGPKATKEQQDRFTRVLKGHIAIAQAVFPVGTTGAQLDSFARASLWQAGLDYGHGTGHGVGHFLCVHEGPQGIHKRSQVALEAGHVVSNEPGFYESGEYGIRIENLLTVKASPHEGFLEFETLTLCPIDSSLVLTKLLTKNEQEWLNDYHRLVYKTLAPLLPAKAKRWLKTATAKIG